MYYIFYLFFKIFFYNNLTMMSLPFFIFNKSSTTILLKFIYNVQIIKRYYPGPGKNTSKLLNKSNPKTSNSNNLNIPSVPKTPTVPTTSTTSSNMSKMPQKVAETLKLTPTQNNSSPSTLTEQTKNMSPGYHGFGSWLNINKPTTLPTASGKNFETNITKDTKVSDLTTQELSRELQCRELARTDLGYTTTSIKDSNGDQIVIGQAQHGIKLTTLGQAYVNKIRTKNKEVNTNTKMFEMPKDKNLKLIITVPPKANENVFIESGKQKHLLVVYNEKNNDYYAIGYFTSKESDKKLADKQFKTFQEEKDNSITENTIKSSNKKQYFVEFEIPERIAEEDLRIPKYGDEYLKHIKQSEYFETVLETLSKVPYNEFNKDGITQENGLDMCKEHDENAKYNKKHPQTAGQIKQQELNKLKQKEKQKNKNIEKDSKNINHENS